MSVGETAIGQNFYRRVSGQKGWRRLALAFLFGILGTGAMPPLHGVFLLVPALSGLLWLIFSGPSSRNAFACGWWFGMGHFSAGLYWISNALLVDAARYGWLAPLAVFGVAGVLAFFTAFVSLLTRTFARHSSGVGRVFIFAAVWTGFEWLRSWVFTGFPWNLIGSVWVFSDAMIQSATLAGVYGLSLLSVIVASIPSILAHKDGWQETSSPTKIILFAALALVVVWAGGALRLSSASDDVVPNVHLRLVQPNIDQKLKWQQDQRPLNLLDQIRMGSSPADPGKKSPTHIIWSETAATFFIGNNANARNAIARGTPEAGLTITGAPRDSTDPANGYRVWNSLLAVNAKSEIVGTYDKHHLVPFGEYMPFRSILGFTKLTAGSRDFSAGSGALTLKLKGLPPVSPLICYEVIFPGRVVNANNRPGWMLNLTNDGWYGVSSGPYQHFAASRLRAVEEGLPLVRVANTGISGVIDGYGRVVASLKLDTKGVLDSALPRALKGTLYGRLGDWMVIFLILLSAGAGALMKTCSRGS
ncbi:MAG: apolipoprotein N-acyltransferase [Rhodospirillales bacterium]|nr:apolipoprotein N-acyltransferase [Rhodospirillales bacterium]